MEPILERLVPRLIADSLAAVNNKIDDLKTSLIELGNKTTDANLKVDAMGLEFHEKTTTISSQMNKIQKAQDDLQDRFQVLDRASRNCNLKVHGIQIQALEGKTVRENLVTSIMKSIEEAGVTGITDNDFDTITRVTPSGQQQFLHVRMRTPFLKRKFYSQRVKFRQCVSRIFINEDLTQKDSSIYKRARTQVKEGILHSAWSLDGVIYGKSSPDGKPYKIRDL